MNFELFDNEELIALLLIDIEKQQLDSALEKLKAVLQHDDRPEKIHAIAGSLYAQIKLFNHSEAHFRDYLDINPDAIHEKFELGMVCFDSGKIDTALAVWDELLSKQPQHPPSLYYSALACNRLDMPEEAQTRLQLIVETTISTNLYHGKANTELLQISDQKKAVQNSPREPAVTH